LIPLTPPLFFHFTLPLTWIARIRLPQSDVDLATEAAAMAEATETALVRVQLNFQGSEQKGKVIRKLP